MAQPKILLFDASSDERDAAEDLKEKLLGLSIEAPFVLASQHGATFAATLDTVAEPERPDGADQDAAMALGSKAKRAGADAIVAVGGGRALDIGKLAAARAGLMMVAVPTQLSHDGICSPVAVVPNDEGRAESLGAVEPRAVYLSMPTLLRSPARSIAAGLGDLVANPLALKDWALAAEHGLETIDQTAWDLSVQAFEMIEMDLDAPPRPNQPEPIKRLAQALILSGEAMIVSGTSRPASGGEHEVSHAIDQLFPGRAMHGEQVAFGSIVSVALYGEDTDAFRERLDRVGLPSHPRQLGLTEAQMVEVLLEAPETRPGRFTIIEEADLDRGSAQALVRRIWS